MTSISYRNRMLTIQYSDLSFDMYYHGEQWCKAPSGVVLSDEGQKKMDKILETSRAEVKRRKKEKNQ